MIYGVRVNNAHEQIRESVFTGPDAAGLARECFANVRQEPELCGDLYCEREGRAMTLDRFSNIL